MYIYICFYPFQRTNNAIVFLYVPRILWGLMWGLIHEKEVKRSISEFKPRYWAIL